MDINEYLQNTDFVEYLKAEIDCIDLVDLAKDFVEENTDPSFQALVNWDSDDTIVKLHTMGTDLLSHNDTVEVDGEYYALSEVEQVILAWRDGGIE